MATHPLLLRPWKQAESAVFAKLSRIATFACAGSDGSCTCTGAVENLCLTEFPVD